MECAIEGITKLRDIENHMKITTWFVCNIKKE